MRKNGGNLSYAHSEMRLEMRGNGSNLSFQIDEAGHFGILRVN